MSTKPMYVQLHEKYPETIVLQLRGAFYNAFAESAIVLSEIFGFKLIKKTEKGTYKSGFPAENSEEKFIRLKQEGVSYVVKEADRIIDFYDAKEINKFKQFLEMSSVCVGDNREKEDTQTHISKTVKEGECITVHLLEDVSRRFETFCEAKKDFDKEVCFNWLLDEGLKKWGY